MLIRNDIDKLDILFNSWLEEKIIDYRIVLLLNSRIEIHFLVNQRVDLENLFTEYEELKGLENLITFYQIEFEDQGDKDFFQGDRIDLGLRRRLSNFINPNDREVKKPCPVITFYSYKGGTGRTTSLAYFASWLATNHGKKVVIIDCDFEAPGLTNYFDIIEERKGIVEYLFDIEYAKLKGDNLDIKKDYAHQVRYEYVGKGDIFIVPAGNLSTKRINGSERTFRSDYLEALARLDITSADHIVQQFETFFSELQKQLELDYENSVILIDSRTGFNDTFAVLSTLSDIIIGFFGINKQSQVGITQFLDTFGTVENTHNKQILLTNSISENRKHELAFKEIISSYISENEEKFTDENLGKKDFANKIFRIPRKEFLGKLGSSLESDDKGLLKNNGENSKDLINMEFYEKVQRPDSEFEDFFTGIFGKIEPLYKVHQDLSVTQEIYVPTETALENIEQSFKPNEVFFESIKYRAQKVERRVRLLKNLVQENNFPKAYADSDNHNLTLNAFFFRDCLKDIFNRDKFIIIGYKGTGKTYIYQSFKNREITNTLCKRERQNANNFIFVNVIPVFYRKKNEQDDRPDETNKYFDVNSKFSLVEIEKVGADFFYERFWLAYIWNQIFCEREVAKLNISLSNKLTSINNDNDSAHWFRTVIADDNTIINFERDLKVLDNKLKDLNKTIILSFDQLDFIVKPENWSIGIAPLIKYCRGNIFSKIYPKIFVRADIYENKLSDITNINELLEKSIDLQWSKQELFAYFFKYVFSKSKEDFFALGYCFNDFSEQSKLKLLQIEKDLDSEGQILVTKEDQLRFLVEIFFGKNANRYEEQWNNYGVTYDWFYDNLKDAKNTISIRPFLDLLKKAIELALTQDSLANAHKYFYQVKQILSAFYFTNKDATSYAAQSYFIDLAKEKGNEPLRLFYQYIRNDGLDRFRYYEFKRELLDELLRRIIDFPNYNNEESLKGKSVDDFKNLLVSNGILKVEHTSNRQFTRYIIPFLYRSYFGVRRPNNNLRIQSSERRT